jgi:hypothetical protein
MNIRVDHNIAYNDLVRFAETQPLIHTFREN